jgi:hypothetical protein
VLNAVLVVLTQKAQKILKEVCGNFANKKPTLLRIGLVCILNLERKARRHLRSFLWEAFAELVVI